MADPAVAGRIAAVEDAVAALDHVVGVRPTAVSPDGTVSLATVQLDATGEKIPVSDLQAIVAVVDGAGGDGLSVDAGGYVVQSAESAEGGSEQIGMVAALFILLIAFGSVLAAGLPVLVALFGIGVSVAGVELLLNVFVVPDWAVMIMTMIGIGVGIDYALFVVTRYRAALGDGHDPEGAVVVAITTAGRAVLFAGGTVVISLLGLCAMGLDYLYGTAAVTVMGVLVVMAASLTLLPAMLGFVGTDIDRLRVPFVKGDRGEQGLWARWSRVVQRRPGVTGLVALVVLLALAVPYTSMRFGYPDPGHRPHLPHQPPCPRHRVRGLRGGRQRTRRGGGGDRRRRRSPRADRRRRRRHRRGGSRAAPPSSTPPATPRRWWCCRPPAPRTRPPSSSSTGSATKPSRRRSTAHRRPRSSVAWWPPTSTRAPTSVTGCRCSSGR